VGIAGRDGDCDESRSLGLLVTGITIETRAPGQDATTVDHLSSGRWNLGSRGVGDERARDVRDLWARAPGRAALRGATVIRSLWTQDRTNFDGRYYKMRNAVANPKPVQKPYPPIGSVPAAQACSS